MGNMSYCRFENTRGDLADCVEALDSGLLPNSESERKHAKWMRDLCAEYIQLYDEAEEMDDDGWSDDEDEAEDDEEDDDA